jgi:hypothetical protein
MRKHTAMGHWQEKKKDEAHSKHTFTSSGNLGNKFYLFPVLILS